MRCPLIELSEIVTFFIPQMHLKYTSCIHLLDKDLMNACIGSDIVLAARDTKGDQES